jgi:hypothetical protein
MNLQMNGVKTHRDKVKFRVDQDLCEFLSHAGAVSVERLRNILEFPYRVSEIWVDRGSAPCERSIVEAESLILISDPPGVVSGKFLLECPR